MHKQLMEDIEESILQISMELLHVSNDWFTQLSYEKWAFDDFFSLIHNVLLYLLPEQHIVFKQAVQPAGVFQPRQIRADGAAHQDILLINVDHLLGLSDGRENKARER